MIIRDCESVALLALGGVSSRRSFSEAGSLGEDGLSGSDKAFRHDSRHYYCQLSMTQGWLTAFSTAPQSPISMNNRIALAPPLRHFALPRGKRQTDLRLHL